MKTDPRAPRLKHTASAEATAAAGVTALHTAHCLASGEVMVSTMGDADGYARGDFLLLDQELKIKGKWSAESDAFGYDFWYAPRHNVMLSTGWGAPRAFRKGFDPADVAAGPYSSSITVWDWAERRVAQRLELGEDGRIPLEVRFLHDPAAAVAFVGAALGSNVIRVAKAEGGGDGGKWAASVAIRQEWLDVEGWALPRMPPLITDILISMDDKYLYFR